MRDIIDLGHGHSFEFVGWAPDRDLNPQFKDVPDVEKYGATIYHNRSDGTPCAGFVTFAGEVQRRVEPNRPNTWDVASWDPLTLSPSVLCGCGDHGWIRDGRWVVA